MLLSNRRRSNVICIALHSRHVNTLLLLLCCRTAEEMFIALGGSIGYWQGNINTLVDDIGALKPSIFIGVPRVYDRIYSRVTDQVGRGIHLRKQAGCHQTGKMCVR
jgi:long-subunit acyl-CoA synthetase (AMP-forming)